MIKVVRFLKPGILASGVLLALATFIITGALSLLIPKGWLRTNISGVFTLALLFLCYHLLKSFFPDNAFIALNAVKWRAIVWHFLAMLLCISLIALLLYSSIGIVLKIMFSILLATLFLTILNHIEIKYGITNIKIND